MQARQSDQWLTSPEVGGIYREGILVSSPRDLDELTTPLTHLGLVRLGIEKTIEPALATQWTMSDDAQNLTLTLDDRINASHILEIINQQSTTGYWKDATITAPGEHQLNFQLAKPWAGFISELTTPIFPYGPYQISSHNETDGTIVLVPNPAALTPPYLTKLELHIFSDTKSLDRAIRKNSLDGVFLPETDGIKVPNHWTKREPTIDRQQLVIFNLRKEKLQDVTVRQKLIRGEKLSEPLEIRLAVAEVPLLAEFAGDLQKKWADLNVAVTVEAYPTLTLTKTVIPERNYDAVLLGIDYGADGDLYPYWHSSQMASPGQNVAGYRNKEVDRLLDTARQTLDPAARQDLYHQVQSILSTEAVMLPFEVHRVTYLRSSKIKGSIPETFSSNASRWTTIGSWYTKEKRIRKTEA